MLSWFSGGLSIVRLWNNEVSVVRLHRNDGSSHSYVLTILVGDDPPDPPPCRQVCSVWGHNDDGIVDTPCEEQTDCNPRNPFDNTSRSLLFVVVDQPSR